MTIDVFYPMCTHWGLKISIRQDVGMFEDPWHNTCISVLYSVFPGGWGGGGGVLICNDLHQGKHWGEI